MIETYKSECKQIKQNAEYSAETHHIIADRSKRQSFWFEVVPAIIAAITGGLVAGQIAPTPLLWLTVISSVVSAIANVLNPKKDYYDHLNAAKNFTTIKHDARALHETFASGLSENEFKTRVEQLHQRYNDLVMFVPPTDKESFEQARIRVQSGLHAPDRDSKGSIK